MSKDKIQVFDEEDLQFLSSVGATRNGDKLIQVLQKLVDYLNDSRTVPITDTSEDFEKALGRAVLSRRMAAQVIEYELIDQLRMARSNANIKKNGQVGYR